MVELRFNALKQDGQAIVGTISSSTVRDAKKKINALVQQHGLKTKSIEKKSTFVYKIRRGSEKPITGAQKAFNKEEVTTALTKLGFQVMSVNKKLFDFQPKPPVQEIVSFVKISAELMEQKLPFAEIMTLLTSDLENKTLRERNDALSAEVMDLKNGLDAIEERVRNEMGMIKRDETFFHIIKIKK